MNATVLVTGISGFIAKHVALELLNAGYQVRGTVREAAAADAVRSALALHGADLERLSFVVADLDRDAGWQEAIAGCEFIQHVASPFPIKAPDDRESLVPAAREGTLRILRHGLKAGVSRIVETSSMVAMMYRADRSAHITVSENDWSDPEWPSLSAYIVSKTRAERAAWEFLRAAGAEEKLCSVNPGFVLGPLLDKRLGTSAEVIRLFMTGAYPAVPPVFFPVVDVRDLAAVHVRAMTSAESGGRRLIAAGETISMRDMAMMLRDAFPAHARHIPSRVLPPWLVRLLGRFDRQLRTLRSDLGVVPHADSAYVTRLTDVHFRPAREAVVAAGQSLLDYGVI
jgi:nucleoside-diphosphate-sugar epimerase